MGEAVGQGRAILHQGAPVLAQHLDVPCRGIVRLPHAQPVGVATHQFQEQSGVLRVALRSAAKEGLAVIGRVLGGTGYNRRKS
jgi:hypothetical protein